MEFTNTWTGNWKNAIHGLRHPMESYAKSDSEFGIGYNKIWIDQVVDKVTDSYIQNWNDERVDPNKKILKENLLINGILSCSNHASSYAFIGANDLDLAQRMIKAGAPNDKFLRQIFISVDIKAPLYWWKEMDTYKVGTTANSTSTMHKLASTSITRECFEIDDFDGSLIVFENYPYSPEETINDMWDSVIDVCESLRKRYLETKDIRYWKELIRILPESWLQTRTWTANYAVLRSIYHWRKNHKLSEWESFCNWVEDLPYANELLLFEN